MKYTWTSVEDSITHHSHTADWRHPPLHNKCKHKSKLLNSLTLGVITGSFPPCSSIPLSLFICLVLFCVGREEQYSSSQCNTSTSSLEEVFCPFCRCMTHTRPCLLQRCLAHGTLRRTLTHTRTHAHEHESHTQINYYGTLWRISNESRWRSVTRDDTSLSWVVYGSPDSGTRLAECNKISHIRFIKQPCSIFLNI